MTVRTRMAPSPTGEYHVGGLRTLLYNYALARKDGGQFIMRIEDTDQKREIAGATDRLLAVIKDYGLEWDELYTQSDRVDIYREHAQELVDKDLAYRCFCTEARLDNLRKEQEERGLPKTFYDRKCRNLTKEEVSNRLESGEASVIRLKVPDDEEIVFEDAVLGEIRFNTSEIDDGVLMKSDGFPTYHLAVVIDDHLMKISHILRGNEWVPSIPKHVLIYRAFGWEMPVHGHLPNLKEKGANKKLSKRFGDVHANVFLERGYLPEAMLNFLMFLGWNPGTEKEIYSLEEFVNDFSIERVHKTDLVAFDRDKLLWFNGHYIRDMDVGELHGRILEWRAKYNVELPAEFLGKDTGVKVLKLVQERLRKFDELSESVGYFFEDPKVSREMLGEFTSDEGRTKTILADFIELFSASDSWTSADLDKTAHSFIEKKSYKPKEAFMTIRVAVSGTKVTPPLFDILEVIGKDKTLERLTTAQHV